ncbi:hypothetical protein DUNSADRAFT_14349 [Dunaliella salina]|uniref:Uncharacterized protein n=1 Tax=Dunaliella salina TaxID=3046 RepID=A0ABQ7G7I6_DUNSA|nr:hypothetical protein DUNSADRAFT_14349 [Dunaliella salina]|eukprot:KAF5830564.1 hypothetical protein DUNSADRAFT_14349 [Dunaliella salina]
MLLLLKKFLREAYRLADDRVAAYAGPGGTVLASSKKMEEKAGVARDARIQLMLYDDVLDLSAPDHAPSSKPARELYKTIKYLISEDAANYRPPPSLNGELADGAAAAREDGGTAAEGAEGEEGGTLPSVARSAKPAAGRGRKRQPQQPKRKSKKKRWGNASSEEEEEEENEGEDGANAGQDSDDANFGPSKPAKRGRHAHAGKATAAGGGRGEGGGAQGGAAPRRAGSRQRKKKSGMEDYDEGSE